LARLPESQRAQVCLARRRLAAQGRVHAGEREMRRWHLRIDQQRRLRLGHGPIEVGRIVELAQKHQPIRNLLLRVRIGRIDLERLAQQADRLQRLGAIEGVHLVRLKDQPIGVQVLCRPMLQPCLLAWRQAGMQGSRNLLRDVAFAMSQSAPGPHRWLPPSTALSSHARTDGCV
jgi:hypothetical protein